MALRVPGGEYRNAGSGGEAGAASAPKREAIGGEKRGGE